MQSIRLKPGFLLFPGPEGDWYLYGPGDRLIRLREEPERIALLARHLYSEQAAEETIKIADLLEAFSLYGLLEGAGDEQPAPPVRRVAVVGTGAVADKVRELLAESSITSVAGPADDPSASSTPSPDLLIACAGWLPDASWRRLDAWCSERRIAWHRSYHEGLAIHLGPLTIPGSTASYADTRARRLATAPFPGELEALWQHLDSASCVPEPPPVSPAAASLIAGLLVADALAFLEHRPAPALGHALEVDLTSLAVHRRPVLPVPRGALTEGAE